MHESDDTEDHGDESLYKPHSAIVPSAFREALCKLSLLGDDPYLRMQADLSPRSTRVPRQRSQPVCQILPRKGGWLDPSDGAGLSGSPVPQCQTICRVRLENRRPQKVLRKTGRGCGRPAETGLPKVPRKTEEGRVTEVARATGSAEEN